MSNLYVYKKKRFVATSCRNTQLLYFIRGQYDMRSTYEAHCHEFLFLVNQMCTDVLYHTIHYLTDSLVIINHDLICMQNKRNRKQVCLVHVFH